MTPLLRLLSVALLPLSAACRQPPEPGDPLRDLDTAEVARFEQGRVVFDSVFIPETGLGPLFNAPGCAACHGVPASGGEGAIFEVHATALREDGFCDPLAALGGPVFQLRVTPALREALGLEAEPIPAAATDTARRTTPDVFGFGLLDAIPESTILALADPDDTNGDGISGRPNRFFDGRLGRFGRKAVVPTLAEFNEGAFVLEQGVTTPNLANEGTVGAQPLPDGVDPTPEPELDSGQIALADAFVRFLAPPAAAKLTGEARRGRELFSEIGCADCHVPTLRTGRHPVRALAYQDVHAYTDLLLHDLGPELADICLGLVAQPAEFRTEPLMGLRLMSRFLHDGRAATVAEAIELHGGEGAAARDTFANLPEAGRRALLAFLGSL